MYSYFIYINVLKLITSLELHFIPHYGSLLVLYFSLYFILVLSELADGLLKFLIVSKYHMYLNVTMFLKTIQYFYRIISSICCYCFLCLKIFSSLLIIYCTINTNGIKSCFCGTVYCSVLVSLLFKKKVCIFYFKTKYLSLIQL